MIDNYETIHKQEVTQKCTHVFGSKASGIPGPPGPFLMNRHLKFVSKYSYSKQSKSNLHYTRGITPKHMTSGGIDLCGLAPGQHNF